MRILAREAHDYPVPLTSDRGTHELIVGIGLSQQSLPYAGEEGRGNGSSRGRKVFLSEDQISELS